MQDECPHRSQIEGITVWQMEQAHALWALMAWKTPFCMPRKKIDPHWFVLHGACLSDFKRTSNFSNNTSFVKMLLPVSNVCPTFNAIVAFKFSDKWPAFLFFFFKKDQFSFDILLNTLQLCFLFSFQSCLKKKGNECSLWQERNFVSLFFPLGLDKIHGDEKWWSHRAILFNTEQPVNHSSALLSSCLLTYQWSLQETERGDFRFDACFSHLIREMLESAPDASVYEVLF